MKSEFKKLFFSCMLFGISMTFAVDLLMIALGFFMAVHKFGFDAGRVFSATLNVLMSNIFARFSILMFLAGNIIGLKYYIDNK